MALSSQLLSSCALLFRYGVLLQRLSLPLPVQPLVTRLSFFFVWLDPKPNFATTLFYPCLVRLFMCPSLAPTSWTTPAPIAWVVRWWCGEVRQNSVRCVCVCGCACVCVFPTDWCRVQHLSPNDSCSG